MNHLDCDASVCTDCRICQLICAFTKLECFNPKKGLLRISVEKEGQVARPWVCLQCKNPMCAKVCPVDAIVKDEETGIVKINPDDCTGCGECAQACLQSVIVLEGDVARKCDLCGGNPVCVDWCPTGALSYREEVKSRVVCGEGIAD